LNYTKLNFSTSSTIDILLDPAKKEVTDNQANYRITYLKSVFDRLNKKVALPSLFTILWYATLPCFDLKGVTSNKDGEKALLKSCIWKGIT
jgi:hypothetical protein